MDNDQNNSNFGQSNPAGFNVPTGNDRGTSTSHGANANSGRTDTATCAHCGATIGENQTRGLEQFLGRIGISEDMVKNLKSSLQNVDVEEYLNTAREYLKTGSSKSGKFVKENPGKIAAGVAVLAVGAGLLISSLRDRDTDIARIDVVSDEGDKRSGRL